MTDLDPSWRPYVRLQLQSRRRSRMDAMGWGLEAALHLLDFRANDNFSDLEAEANEAIARGKARERNRTRLRVHYHDPRQVNEPTLMLDDRARLHEVFARADQTECDILLATRYGHSSATIASRLLVEPATVRNRINRLRVKLARAG
jgi:DNA-binding NarL/FixJ family response regulator